MMNRTASFIVLVTILYRYVHLSLATEAFRAICKSNDHTLAGLFAKLTAHLLACARQCQNMDLCNYWAIRGNESLLSFATTQCERNTAGGEMWVTYVKAGPIQTCDCGPGIVAFRNSCYIFPAGTYTWTQANDTCAGLGAGLVELGDLYEHDFLVFQARERGYTRMWLGGSDSANEGTFIWNSDAPFTFNKWHPGEPNNSGGGEDYAELYVAHSTWNDHNVGQIKPIACELSCF